MTARFASAAIVAALALSLASLITALTGEVDVGVVSQDPGGVVLEVVPDSAAWLAGIRPGQRVVRVAAADDPGGWSIETDDGSAPHRVSASSANSALRITAVGGAAALLLVLLAIRDRETSRRRAELSVASAAVLSVAPFLVYPAAVPFSVLAVGAAGIAPAAWLARWRVARPWVGVATVVSALAVSVAWGAARTLPAPALRPVGDVWALAVVAGTIAMLLLGTGMTAARAVRALAAIRFLDAVVVALAAMAASIAYAAGLPIVWAAAVVLVPLAIYARSRQAIRGSLDRLLLAEMRERAAMRATEAERARMAREIHDDPLQAIAGVIRFLDQPAPDADSARDALREVAARLRGVATELHPPVLDDLGLVPAIEAAARGSDSAVPIEVRIEDRTGYSAYERPPADVELGLFRMVQESLANAVRHSRAQSITVSGDVGADAVRLTVADDGTGIPRARAEAALREGHLGISSIRQRAAGIDAAVDIDSREGGGTRVRIRWPA